jgi:hypothetical protein
VTEERDDKGKMLKGTRKEKIEGHRQKEGKAMDRAGWYGKD